MLIHYRSRKTFSYQQYIRYDKHAWYAYILLYTPQYMYAL